MCRSRGLQRGGEGERRARLNSRAPLPGDQRSQRPVGAPHMSEVEDVACGALADPVAFGDAGASTLWQPCGPSEQHRLTADVVVQLGLEPAVVEQVDLKTEHVLDELLEPDEPERRCPIGSLNQQV